MAVDMPVPIAVGQLLGGKFRIERLLGEGGMGVVVAAHHVDLEIPVALKFLRREACSDGAAVARFLKEGRALARLKSQNIVRVHDVGTLNSGEPYLVMEYLEGRDLATELAVRGRLPAEEAVEYVLQAAEAICEAHSVGIVHRDLKPQNLFLAARGEGKRLVKVLDFGIAQMSLSTKDDITRTAAVMGSPHYMSPEQLRSTRDSDHRTDIWSLGVVLYQLCTGRLPFDADTLPGICLSIVNDAPQPPSVDALLPAATEAVILRCLQKRSEDRFQSVGELVTALRGTAEPQTVQATRANAVTPPMGHTPTPMSGTVARRDRSPSSGHVDRESASPPTPTELEQTQDAWGATRSGGPSPVVHVLVALAGVAAVSLVATLSVRWALSVSAPSVAETAGAGTPVPSEAPTSPKRTLVSERTDEPVDGGASAQPEPSATTPHEPVVRRPASRAHAPRNSVPPKPTGQTKGTGSKSAAPPPETVAPAALPASKPVPKPPPASAAVALPGDRT